MLLRSSVANVTSWVMVNKPPAARASGPACPASGGCDTALLVAERAWSVVAMGVSCFVQRDSDGLTVVERRGKNMHPKVQEEVYCDIPAGAYEGVVPAVRASAGCGLTTNSAKGESCACSAKRQKRRTRRWGGAS